VRQLDIASIPLGIEGLLALPRAANCPPTAESHVAPRGDPECVNCGSTSRWLSAVSGREVCRVCAPPAPGAEVRPGSTPTPLSRARTTCDSASPAAAVKGPPHTGQGTPTATASSPGSRPLAGAASGLGGSTPTDPVTGPNPATARALGLPTAAAAPAQGALFDLGEDVRELRRRLDGPRGRDDGRLPGRGHWKGRRASGRGDRAPGGTERP
jgi:hypothetical protein